MRHRAPHATARPLSLLLLAAVCSAAVLSGCVSAGTASVGGPARASAAATATLAATAAPAPAQPATSAPATVPPVTAKPMAEATFSASSVKVPADNALLEWNFRHNKKHAVPEIPATARKLAKRYGAMYVGPDSKLVYLTFDEGYENGNTPRILDALKRNDVPATFFVTGDFCREAPKLCRRMLAEGHVVGNHSDKHPSMPSLASDRARFEAQFTKADAAFKKATGEHLTHLFRPPMGNYSARSLAMTQRLGYTSVFWSFAHVDYDEKRQPPVATTVSRVLAGSHPGAIFLLHGMSTSDTAALDDIIAGLREQGYEFGALEPR